MFSKDTTRGKHSAAQYLGNVDEMVEAAGIEPDSGDNLNLLMACDFDGYSI